MAGQKFAGSFIGTVGFSALSGGVGAELTGGDFWKGAGQGAIVGLLNHTQHEVQEKMEGKNYEKMLQEKLKSVKVGGTISGKELGKVLGNPNISYAISKITRVSETNFEVTRTLTSSVSGIIKGNAKMTITETKIVIQGKIESVYRVQIYGYSKLLINQGALPDFYINNGDIWFRNNKGVLCLGTSN